MNKNELVSSVAEKAGLTKVQAGAAVDAFIASVTEALAAGGDVRLPGFGAFEVSHRAATKGRIPTTNVEIDIPARNVPKFSAGKSLKEAVNTK
ncbi:HU family DNA-binding protein [Bartonella sp. HY329]|uniref:HU family DNA-binding protein n=1 Tax=unclassified Bartonella TaxID=2645622 RepID=UPI0021C965E3|nr:MULTISPECIES: HU family DNA-binding protein [unclassified Bartonella]UXM94066.1 HU family DNA-binding protein [Bartonella sp. HY329]UXN08388.1 HU family DNA-binding protein [Bartonella sp. HY328]